MKGRKSALYPSIPLFDNNIGSVFFFYKKDIFKALRYNHEWTTTQTYQEPIISPPLNLQAVNSQPQTTNEFLIILYLIFTMLWDKQL